MDETVKTTQNSKNVTIWSFIFVFCIQLNNLIVYLMVKHRNMPVLAYKEPWMQENGQNKFRTIVSEVLFIVGKNVKTIHKRILVIGSITLRISLLQLQ